MLNHKNANHSIHVTNTAPAHTTTTAFSGTQLLLSNSKHMERTELKKGCSFKVLTTRQLGHQQVIPGACKSQAKLTRAP
jgi:hypothetical protein